MRLTFLGTGTSFGVPQVGCACRTCGAADPRDKRTRAAALVESDGRRLLIDTPPELRLQLVAAAVPAIDAVLFTHAHADHVHGIDDLRAISVRRDGPLPMYGPAESLARLAQRFPYIFDESMKPIAGTSKPEALARALEEGVRVTIGDAEVTPVAVPHGFARVFAYRIGPLAYVTDAKSIPPAALDLMRGAKVLVVNALFRTEHPTHLSVPEAIRAAQAVGAERTYLTHLTHEYLHADLEAELPRGMQPAFDGLVVRID